MFNRASQKNTKYAKFGLKPLAEQCVEAPLNILVSLSTLKTYLYLKCYQCRTASHLGSSCQQTSIIVIEDHDENELLDCTGVYEATAYSDDRRAWKA